MYVTIFLYCIIVYVYIYIYICLYDYYIHIYIYMTCIHTLHRRCRLCNTHTYLLIANITLYSYRDECTYKWIYNTLFMNTYVCSCIFIVVYSCILYILYIIYIRLCTPMYIKRTIQEYELCLLGFFHTRPVTQIQTNSRRRTASSCSSTSATASHTQSEWTHGDTHTSWVCQCGWVWNRVCSVCSMERVLKRCKRVRESTVYVWQLVLV